MIRIKKSSSGIRSLVRAAVAQNEQSQIRRLTVRNGASISSPMKLFTTSNGSNDFISSSSSYIMPTSLRYCGRSFSTVTAEAAKTSSSSSSSDGKNNNNTDGEKKDSSSSSSSDSSSNTIRDAFIDNLGKIFLAFIVSVIASLVRSSYGTSNRNAVRDHIEDVAALDPLEIDDLRIANSTLDAETFRIIMQSLLKDDRLALTTYDEFVQNVREIMIQSKQAKNYTIELGHLLDRVVIAVLEKRQETTNTNKDQDKGENTMVEQQISSVDDGSSSSRMMKMPLSFWLTLLTLALNSSISERLEILYEIVQISHSQDNNNNEEATTTETETTTTTTLKDVIEVIGYLQDTCQLVPDAQVIPTDVKYPTQQYRIGTPKELVNYAISNMKEEKEKDKEKVQLTDADESMIMDYDQFLDILYSRSVCPWGECYNKKKR